MAAKTKKEVSEVEGIIVIEDKDIQIVEKSKCKRKGCNSHNCIIRDSKIMENYQVSIDGKGVRNFKKNFCICNDCGFKFVTFEITKDSIFLD